MSVKRISKVEELFPALYGIGSIKNMLPKELRGWVNILELYVQLRDKQLLTSSIESLVAGGKWIGYFFATCDFPLGHNWTKATKTTMFSDFSDWKIEKFNQQVWERRFAHLVEPTSEIAWYLFENLLRTRAGESDIEKFNTQTLPKAINAAKHFRSTGEWVGLRE